MEAIETDAGGDKMDRAVQDLETLADAVEELDERGIEADDDVLAETGRIFDELLDTAEESGKGDTEAAAMMENAREAIDAIRSGDGDEDDVETAQTMAVTVGEQLQIALLGAALGI